MLPISRFAKLERLDITVEQVINADDMVRYNALDPDYDSDRGFDIMMDELWELVRCHPHNGDHKVTATLFFDKCPSLKRICIISTYIEEWDIYDAKRSADGSKLLDVVKNEDFWHPDMASDREAPAPELQLDRDSWPRTMVSRRGHPSDTRFEKK